MHDKCNNKTRYHSRQDVLLSKVYLPNKAPPEFNSLQYLCNAIDSAEKRYDARTAREFKGSLPNELSLQDQERIIDEFIERNFVL